MGEAGAEGILPLKRDGQGRLGVMAQGGGGGMGGLQFSPTTNFYIDSRSDRGAVLADMGRAMQANNESQMDQLKRLKVVSQ
jgi:phage-related minor tail protein